MWAELCVAAYVQKERSERAEYGCQWAKLESRDLWVARAEYGCQWAKLESRDLRVAISDEYGCQCVNLEGRELREACMGVVELSWKAEIFEYVGVN